MPHECPTCGKKYGCKCPREKSARSSRAEQAFDSIFLPKERPKTTPKNICICVDPVKCAQEIREHVHNCTTMDCWTCHPVFNKEREEQRKAHEESLRHRQKVAPEVSYRQVLGLSRDTLVELLETKIGTAMQPDLTQPKQKVLKPVGPLKTRIADLKTSIAQAEKAVAELRVQIKEHEDILKGLEKKVMDTRRRDNPDDIIQDKNTRERYRYEEDKKLEELGQEKRNLEKQVRDSRHELLKLQIRVNNFGSNPDDVELRRPIVEVPLKLRDTFVLMLQYEGFDFSMPQGFEYGIEEKEDRDRYIDSYIQLVYVYGAADSQFKTWKHFENRIVLRAIAWNLIQVPEDVIKAHPEIQKPDQWDYPPEDETDERVMGRATRTAKVLNWMHARLLSDNPDPNG